MNRLETFRLSGLECAAALQRLGHEFVRSEDGWSVLRRGKRLVVIPEAAVLPSAILDLVLARANVSLGDVLLALDEIPTQPDLRCL
jgi:hypothetical protein